jgi:hypothetical protein
MAEGKRPVFQCANGLVTIPTLKVTSPSYQFIECSASGGVQSIPNNSTTSLTIWGIYSQLGDAIVKADDNDYDFVVLEDGIYSVEGTITFSANPTGERVFIAYIQGSNKAHELDSATSPNAKRMHIYARDFMRAGDRIRLAAYQNSGGNLDVGTGAGLQRMTIFKEQ